MKLVSCLSLVLMVVALSAAPANAGATFNTTLSAISDDQGCCYPDHSDQSFFHGVGTLPNIGSFTFTGSEVQGCPYGESCFKGLTLTLTGVDGSTINLGGGWGEDCTYDPATGAFISCPAFPTVLPWRVTGGTGRFAKYHGSGTWSWSYAGFYPSGGGTPIALTLTGSLK